MGWIMNPNDKASNSMEAAIATLRTLTPAQVEVLTSIMAKFSEDQKNELIQKDFIDEAAFDYFSMRLAAHHASSGVPLKKENFEHILQHSFARSGHLSKLADSMVHRGADLEVDGRFYSLKTEAAKGLNPKSITISKLMEARWIRDLNGPEDAPNKVKEKILSHLSGYDRIFMLRSYGTEKIVRYDLREIPKYVISSVETLSALDFRPLTAAGGTSAEVKINGQKAFRLVLDGSVEKITISGLSVELCPLHAWWTLGRPG